MEIVSNLSVFKTTIKILLLVTPPLFYFKIFMPCWCAAPELTPHRLPSLTPHPHLPSSQGVLLTLAEPLR